MKTIHVAIGSTMSHPGDIAKNMAQIGEFARRAASDGAALLLTPEMSATGMGSYPDVLALSEAAGQGPVYRELARIAAGTGVVIAAGFAESNGELRHNSHYIVYPDGKFSVQRKHRVTINEVPMDPSVPLKPRLETEDAGQPTRTEFTVFEVAGVRCCVVICYDFGIESLNRILASLDVELVLLATGGGGKREERLSLDELGTPEGLEQYRAMLNLNWEHTLTDCIEYGRGLAAVNICGHDGRNYYHGGSGSLINFMGEIVGYLPFMPVLERQRMMYAHAVIEIGDAFGGRALHQKLV